MSAPARGGHRTRARPGSADSGPWWSGSRARAFPRLSSLSGGGRWRRPVFRGVAPGAEVAKDDGNSLGGDDRDGDAGEAVTDQGEVEADLQGHREDGGRHDET